MDGMRTILCEGSLESAREKGAASTVPSKLLSAHMKTSLVPLAARASGDLVSDSYFTYGGTSFSSSELAHVCFMIIIVQLAPYICRNGTQRFKETTISPLHR